MVVWWFYGGLRSCVVFLSGSLVVLGCRSGFVVVLIGSKWLLCGSVVVLSGFVEVADWSRRKAGPAECRMAVVCRFTVSALQTGGKNSTRPWLLIGRCRVWKLIGAWLLLIGCQVLVDQVLIRQAHIFKRQWKQKED